MTNCFMHVLHYIRPNSTAHVYKQLGVVNESVQQQQLKEIHHTYLLVLKHEILFYHYGHACLR